MPPRIGGYKVLRRLATGGTSDVLLARADGPHGHERVVVLKLLLQQFRYDPQFERMFEREAGAYRRLSHPAIVKLHDFFNDSGQLVMVLEYVDGLPLHKLRALLKVRGQQLEATGSAFLASRIFSALSAAHTAKDPTSGETASVIHRDVNPSNVLVPWDGLAKIADFGIAKVTGVQSDTQAGFIKGTYGYMAPEQVRGEEVTTRADVYAACLLLWELLAGRKAIVRGSSSDVEVLRAMAEPAYPALSVLRPDLPKALLDAVGAGLEPKPERRSITAEELAEVLRRSMNLETGAATLVEALAGVRPPAPVEDSLTPPPLNPSPTSADATIPNPLAVKQALASSSTLEGLADGRRSPSMKPLGAKGGTLVLSASPAGASVPPRAPVASIPPRPTASVRPPGASASPGPSPSRPSPPSVAAAAPAPVSPPPSATPAEPPPPAPVEPSGPAQAIVVGASPHRVISPFAATVAGATSPFSPHAVPPPSPPAIEALPGRPPTTDVLGPAPAADASAAAPAASSTTGTTPDAQAFAGQGTRRTTEPTPDDLPAPNPLPLRHARRRGRIAVLVSLALVAAAALGVGVALWQALPDTQSRGPVHAPAPSSSAAGSLGTPTASSPASAAAAAPAPSATPPPPTTAAPVASAPEGQASAAASDSSAPAPAASMGRITVPAERGGHRVWFDKHIVGESPGSFDVPCGWHTVQVGSAGSVQKINVACGAETEVR